MNARELSDKVIAIAKEVMRSEEIALASSMTNVEAWDSLNHIIFLNRVEREFAVEFKFVELIEMVSIEKIVELVSKRFSALEP